MVARFTGAGLGLLAFAVTMTAGLLAQVPVEVTLSRSILALFLFCVGGLLLGGAAQRVVDEYKKERESQIHERFHEEGTATEGGKTGSDSEETSMERATG